MSAAPAEVVLETISGPYPVTCTVSGDRPATIGRSAENELCLLNDSVSRRHATVLRRGSEWYVLNHSERVGTYINGVRMNPERPAALVVGDMLRIGPWTFRVSGSTGHSTLATIDDSGAPRQRVERASSVSVKSDRRLRLLSECIARLASAADQPALARVALDSALTGTGYARGAVLRGLGAGPNIELVDSLRKSPSDTGDFAFSRSLVAQAASGEVSILSTERTLDTTNSIAELHIHSAICAPIFLGGAVEGYLYLDARGREASVHGEAAGFCEAITRAYGLALANLKRIELQQRQRVIEQDMQAAREAQEMMLPAPHGEIGPIRYSMQMRPGLFIAGDLFDAIDLGDGRAAVCVGDVAGHGLGSGMIMSMTQAYLHAQLRAGHDPAAAAGETNRFICRRAAGGRFSSLWIGVFEPRAGGATLRYVDAGHGHWMLVPAADREPRHVDGAVGGLPIGIDPDRGYSCGAIDLTAGDRVVVYSDGIIEQRNSAGEMFGQTRLVAALKESSTSSADVPQSLAAVESFTGVNALDDDATIASIQVA